MFGGAIISVAQLGLGLLHQPARRRRLHPARSAHRRGPALPSSAPRPELLKQLDIPGLATASVALIAITFYLVHGQDYGFLSTTGLLALATSIAFSLGFIWTEHHTDYTRSST